MAGMCTDSSDYVKTEDGLGGTETRESGHQSMVGVEFDLTFGTKSWREDSALVVEEKRIYVSRSVLSYVSPVFTQMFEEKINHSGPMEIQFEGKKHDDMVEFLKCIYPNIMAEVTLENVCVVLPLAVEFSIDTLKDQCEDLLLENIDGDTECLDIFKYLRKAFEFNLTRLQIECIDIVSDKDSSCLKEAENEFPLPVAAKLEIQGKMIEKMEPLKNAVKAVQLDELLNGILHVSSLKNPRVGYLEFTTFVINLSEFHKQKTYRSHETTIHGIEWRIEVTTSKPEQFGLYLKAKLSDHDHPKKWTCKVRAVLRVCNHKNDDESITGFFDEVYTNVKGWGFPTFAKMEKIMDLSKGFVKDGEVQVDVRFLVEEPTFE